MRTLMIIGGVIAVLSTAFLFGFVEPRADALNSQMMMLGPMAALQGPEAQQELEDMINAIGLFRVLSIIGISSGGLLFVIGLLNNKNRKNAPANG